nr:AAA family ATPase [Actinomycetota bacterium]
VVASPAVVDLGPAQRSGAEQRWTTVDLLVLEADLEARATRPGSAAAPVGVADATQLGRALNARPYLSAEQADVVAGICFAAEPVVTVVGKAGTGKTFALDAARDAWTASEVPVVGAALAARAAAELQAGSGIGSTTLARLLGDIERPEGRLVPGSVIVVDEAGMVGTRDLHRLIAAAGDQHAKVVLVGDPGQLPEIAAGGSFARLTARTPNHTLTANRRQAQPWERAALDELRDRQPGPALARYGDHGRITLADSGDELRRQMVDDWQAARDAGESVVMLAVRRTDVADLNRRAQQQLIGAGTLNPQGGTVTLPSGQTVVVGDEIVCTRNDRRAGLINGTRLTVTGLEPEQGTITGTTHQPGADLVTIPGDYLVQGHLALGYASTIHKAQGRTVDRALLLGDDRLFAEAGYVGLSRGRTQNQLYVVADTNPLRAGPQPGAGLAEGVCHALGVSHAQIVAAGHVADRIPDAGLPVLVAERDRLADQLIATMPPPPGGDHPQLIGRDTRRDAWTVEHRRDGERLARLTAAVDRRTERLGLAALIDPPDHLIRLLGPPPDTPHGRQAWTETAAALEAWREVSGRSTDHGPRHILVEPGTDRAEHAWWQRATRRLGAYQTRSLHRDQRARLADTPDRDLAERDLPVLDRSWQTDKNRGLNR